VKASLQLRFSQHLALTPQLQQSIRLLQLSTLELNQEIEQLLIDNPLLERTDHALDRMVQLDAQGAITNLTPSGIVAPEDLFAHGGDSSHFPDGPEASPDFRPDSRSDLGHDLAPGAGTTNSSDEGAAQTPNALDNPVDLGLDWGADRRARDDDDEDRERPQGAGSQTSLEAHLLQQLRASRAGPRDAALVEILIGELDSNGWLTTPVETLFADLLERLQTLRGPLLGAVAAAPGPTLSGTAGSGGRHGTADGTGDGDGTDNEIAARQQRADCAALLALTMRFAPPAWAPRNALQLDALVGELLGERPAQTSAGALELEELQTALSLLRSFDPAGVGAGDLAQCLSLQLQRLPRRQWPSVDGWEAACTIVDKHLPLLAARDWPRIKKALGLKDGVEDDTTLRDAQALIRSLQPIPSASFEREDAAYVVPDVVVRRHRNDWIATLNPDVMPRLRVNDLYARILRRSKGASGLATQLQEARWLVKNVQQRFDTILRVAQAIVERQRGFFTHGEVAMRPLVLREIAEVLGLHESTVSRVTTQKYMLTPTGTFELKYFFGSHVATDTGGAASSTAIRALIKQLIAAEDPHQPLSDSRLADLLGEQGIVVARRTVAKYRESLRIPAVAQRKAL